MSENCTKLMIAHLREMIGENFKKHLVTTVETTENGTTTFEMDFSDGGHCQTTFTYTAP
jgi:hypothetical protein